MYKKYCNRCYHSSYSSCHVGQWLCPTCNQDLTNIKAIVASNQTSDFNLYNNYQKQNDLRVSSPTISYKI